MEVKRNKLGLSKLEDPQKAGPRSNRSDSRAEQLRFVAALT